MAKISIDDIDKRDPERMKAIGARLSKVRQELGYSIPGLASLLNVDEKLISRIENGEEFPDVLMLYKLVVSFNISSEWLICGEEPKYIQRFLKLDAKYVELFNLMEIPGIEGVIFHKLYELKLFCKDEIAQFLQNQKSMNPVESMS